MGLYWIVENMEIHQISAVVLTFQSSLESAEPPPNMTRQRVPTCASDAFLCISQALFQQLYISSLTFSVEMTATNLQQMFSDTSYLMPGNSGWICLGWFCFGFGWWVRLGWLIGLESFGLLNHSFQDVLGSAGDFK